MTPKLTIFFLLTFGSISLCAPTHSNAPKSFDVKQPDSVQTFVVKEEDQCPSPYLCPTIHQDFIPEDTNFQKIIHYFKPYLSVLALNFALTLIHEIGHNVVNLAVHKQWSKIWIGGNNLYEDTVFNPQKITDEFRTLLIKKVDQNNYLLLKTDDNERCLRKFKEDPLVSNALLRLYLPNSEDLQFTALISTKPINNAYLNAAYFLGGPVLGALFSWLSFQFVQQNILKFSATHMMFTNSITNMLANDAESSGTDGYHALKALGAPTDWMTTVEKKENVLMASALELTNLEHLVDIAMFGKAFQAKNEQQRMIALMGQMFFKVMVPFATYLVKTASHDLINNVHEFIKKSEDEALRIGAYKAAWFGYGLRISLTVLMPIFFAHALIKQNADTPFASYLTQYF